MERHHMKPARDVIAAAALGAAALGSMAAMADTVHHPQGVYTFTHTRVKPHMQPLADTLLASLVSAREAGQRGLAERIERELAALPRDVISADEVVMNLVTDVGARLMLDTILAGSAFTATTYLGLKGSGAAAVADTQASHSGWLEVGGTNVPVYSGTRKTMTWSAASGTGAGSRTKSSSGTFTFTFTSGGTVDGAFININGAATQDNTTGTLFSAGTFTGGAKVVASTDTLTVTYALSA